MGDYTWFKSYDEGVPRTLEPYPNVTLFDILADTIKQRPNNMMMWFKGNSISYAQFTEYVDTLARALAGIGVKRGDCVVLMMPNCPQAIISQFAVWKVGGIAVPINPRYSESDLLYALKYCSAKIAIVLTPFYELVKKVQKQTDLKTVIVTTVKEYLSPFMGMMFTLLKEKKAGHRIELRQGDLWWKDIMEKYKNYPLPDVKLSTKDTGILLFSGGTTGVPKGVMYSHGAIAIKGIQLRAWWASLPQEWVDKVVLLMPLFHIYGIQIVTVAINSRMAMIIVPDPRDAKDLLTTIKKTKSAFLPAIATIYTMLMNYPDVKAVKEALKSIKWYGNGAATLLPETKKKWEALTGGKIVNIWGLTETGLLTMEPTIGKGKAGSVGLPFPEVEIKIVDMETGAKELPNGEIGEIIARVPTTAWHIMQGYWNRPEATAEMIRDNWLYTGDLGRMDDDGYVSITGRKKEMIKPSGHQVFPDEVEGIIVQHPAVLEVCVAGVNDEMQGEAVKAWVVVRPDKQCSAEDIKSFCKDKLTSYKIPKYVELIDALPKSDVGKVLRRKLQEKELTKGG